MKEYLEFLKDSQRFYREYIQKLNATYGAIPELQQIAQLAAPNSSTCDSLKSRRQLTKGQVSMRHRIHQVVRERKPCKAVIER